MKRLPNDFADTSRRSFVKRDKAPLSQLESQVLSAVLADAQAIKKCELCGQLTRDWETVTLDPETYSQGIVCLDCYQLSVIQQN